MLGDPRVAHDPEVDLLAAPLHPCNHCGDHSVYFAGTHGAGKQAPTRIAFTHLPEIDDTEI